MAKIIFPAASEPPLASTDIPTSQKMMSRTTLSLIRRYVIYLRNCLRSFAPQTAEGEPGPGLIVPLIPHHLKL